VDCRRGRLFIHAGVDSRRHRQCDASGFNSGRGHRSASRLDCRRHKRINHAQHDGWPDRQHDTAISIDFVGTSTAMASTETAGVVAKSQ
jgi:hypothetical protein